MVHKFSTCTFAEIDVKEPEGRLFVRQIIETATQKNEQLGGTDPEIKEMLPKAVYFERRSWMRWI